MPPSDEQTADGCLTDPEPGMDSRRATVRNMRSKCRCSCVLQFTFRRAVSCVLHRPPSQVIHCTVLFLIQACPSRGERNTKSGNQRSPASQTSHHGEGLKNRNPGKAVADIYRLRHLPGGTLPSVPPTMGPGPPQPAPAPRKRGRRRRRGGTRGRLAPGLGHAEGRTAGEGRTTHSDSREGVKRSPSSRARTPLMILPQVHLRKPCYDFYFL